MKDHFPTIEPDSEEQVDNIEGKESLRGIEIFKIRAQSEEYVEELFRKVSKYIVNHPDEDFEDCDISFLGNIGEELREEVLSIIDDGGEMADEKLVIAWPIMLEGFLNWFKFEKQKAYFNSRWQGHTEEKNSPRIVARAFLKYVVGESGVVRGLNVKERALVTAKISEDNLLDEVVGGELIVNIAQEIDKDPELNVQQFDSILSGRNIADSLSTIRLLSRVALCWSSRTPNIDQRAQAFERLFTEWREKTTVPIERYALDNAIERMNKRNGDFGSRPIRYVKGVPYSVFGKKEKIKFEWRDVILPLIPDDQEQYYITQIAPDALAALNFGGVPKYLAKIDSTVIEAIDRGEKPEVTFSASRLNNWFDPFNDLLKDSKNNNLLAQLHAPDMRHAIESDFHIDIGELPVSSQEYFLRYLAGLDPENFDRFKKLMSAHRDIARDIGYAFLALAEDKEYERVIFSLIEKYDEATLGRVLAKYRDISNQLDYYTDIKRKLLLRANKLLQKYAASDAKDSTEILKSLDKIKVENELFLATFKSLNGEDRRRMMEQKEGTGIEVVSASEVNESDRGVMREIYLANYSADKYKNLREKLIESFGQSLKDGNSRFYIFRHENKLVAFCRFSPMDNGHVYFGAFNVDPNFQGSAIGETMISEALNKEAKENVLEADCEADSPIANKYLKSGFKKVKEFTYEGVAGWHIIRDDLGKLEVLQDPEQIVA